MVDINPFPTFQDLEHSNSSAYTPLPDHSTQKDARSVNPRRPLKLLLSIFSGFLLVSLLVILVAHQTPKDQTHIIDEKSSLSSPSSASDSKFISRGVKEGVSEKAFRLDSGEEESFEWTNTKLSRQRSAYHFQPQENWMSDPDGPLFYKGWYHFFYQYNPYAAIWGNISWGHAVSKDLIHWLYLPLAMVPAYWYEHSGVLSGSATLLPDGNIVMLYTGLTKESVQVQNVAFPANLSDPLLLDWVRYSGNPVLFPPPGIGDMDFRDPTTAWYAQGKWYISIGSKLGTTGIALVYETTDFLNYTLLDGLLHSVRTTGVWECVDFYPISTTADNGLDTSVNGPGVKHVLKASVEDVNHDYYSLGTYNVESNTWIPDDPELDVGKGIRYDYGKYYASKTFYDQNKARRLLWGWIGETDSQNAVLQKDWSGLQNIPRVVSFDLKTKSNLLLWPIEEVESLRLGSKEFKNVEMKAGAVVPLDIDTATQLDITAEFEIDSHAIERTIEAHVLYNCETSGGAAERGILGPFGLLVLADESLIEHTAVYFYIAKATDGDLKTYFCSDESRSSIANDIGKKVHGSVVPVLGGEKFSVRILVDHSIIEAFAQGGRTCITSRVYPTKAIYGAARLFLFNNATGVDVTLTSLKIWEMNSAFSHPYPL